MIELAREHLNIYLSAAISGAFLEINEFSSVYARLSKNAGAPETMTYMENEGRLELSKYEDGERKLINFAQSGNLAETYAILEQIADISPKNSTTLLKYLFAAALTKLCRDLPAVDEYFYIKSLNAFEQAGATSDLLAEAKAAFKQMCGFYAGQKDVAFSENIVAYIKENYGDPNLSVNLLGEKFFMSPSYLSKIFKRQTGETLRDYILSIRLQKAKAMLAENKKISNVAIDCGFMDSGTFIRSFKKSEGVTPGEWRETMRSQ
jgi:AraC-like DNA-binding protein